MDSTNPDFNFIGSLEEWDDRVFLHADHFRVHRFHGRGGRDHAKVKSFVMAIHLAVESMKQGKRVLVYAVTATGRYQALEQKRWPHYAKLWLEKTHGTETS